MKSLTLDVGIFADLSGEEEKSAHHLDTLVAGSNPALGLDTCPAFVLSYTQAVWWFNTAAKERSQFYK
jgi:hypothetical protein